MRNNVVSGLPIFDTLKNKIYAYGQTIWKDKWKDGITEQWLENFSNADEEIQYRERLNMLYLLTKFMYFGSEELRQILLSLYRDLFKYPIIKQIREANNNTLDRSIVDRIYRDELAQSRFLGVGNPSESGVHMLYYFRQECGLPKTQFITTADIFSSQRKQENTGGVTRSYLETGLADETIRRYVFIDDFCGTGTQALDYLRKHVEDIKHIDAGVSVQYLMMFGTEFGINQIRKANVFDRVEAVFMLDETFRCFSQNSRYYKSTPDMSIDVAFAHATAQSYGTPLFGDPLGYKDCQLLLGLFHNTPDNSLPIFWGETPTWTPIFKRYNKKYS